MPTFWDALANLPAGALVVFCIALVVAFAFEFINGFHDTANAVTTVIYTRTLSPTPAVIYSGFMNFLGAFVTVYIGSAAVAFTIVNLLPVNLLIDGKSNAALVMVLSLLLAGVSWNLGTWYLGLPVSSSHTLIGAILGVGMANSLLNSNGLNGVKWSKAIDVGLGLLMSPVIGFIAAAVLLLLMKRFIREPRLYVPPQGDDRPPGWIRGILLVTCGAVSYAHGSNDGQKGMGLMLLVLVGFLPAHYALSVNEPTLAASLPESVLVLRDGYQKHNIALPEKLDKDLTFIDKELKDKASFSDLAKDQDKRWELRKALVEADNELKKLNANPNLPEEDRKTFNTIREKHFAASIEFIPLWVVFGTALALGLGTTVGYKRIVTTVAEKIGKTHLTYAQGAAAEAVAAATILIADRLHLPVSTTQILSSGVAGTMVANKSGVQSWTIRRIALAWVLTLPACMLLSAGLFALGMLLFG